MGRGEGPRNTKGEGPRVDKIKWKALSNLFLCVCGKVNSWDVNIFLKQKLAVKIRMSTRKRQYQQDNNFPSHCVLKSRHIDEKKALLEVKCVTYFPKSGTKISTLQCHWRVQSNRLTNDGDYWVTQIFHVGSVDKSDHISSTRSQLKLGESILHYRDFFNIGPEFIWNKN